MMSRLVAAAFMFVVIAFVKPASATQTTVANCVPQEIGYTINFDGEIQLLMGTATGNCGTLAYYHAHHTITGTCSAYSRSPDILKTWVSLAQAAVLAGKKLNITYDTCGGFRYILIMVMLKN